MKRQIIYAPASRGRRRSHPGDVPPSARGGGAAPAEVPDSYSDQLVKYLPAESVGVYLAVRNILLGNDDPLRWALWAGVVAGLVLTPLYLARRGVAARTQLVASTGAFLVWALALGEPFSWLPWWRPDLAAVVLLLYSASLPLLRPASPDGA